MKNFIYIVFVLFLLPVFTYSQTANITAGCSPLEVQFTAPNGFPTWFWDFKDLSTSALQNPVHTFTTPGTFLVEFRQTSGGPVIGTVEINIYPKPDPEILANPTSGCKPLAVNFSNETVIPNGIIVNTIEWIFGDGASSIGNDPNHTYTSAGNFTVSLAIETNFESCNTTEIFPGFIEVSNPPVAAFNTNPNPPVACDPPLLVDITNTSSGAGPLTYNWTFGNGNTSTNQNPAAQNYTTNGQFPIVLTVTDTNNCSAQAQTTVSIGSPQASFNVNDTLCINNQYSFFPTVAAGSYSWNFGSSASPMTSNLSNPIVYFLTEGYTSINLTISNGQCSDDTTVIVYVDQLDATFTSDPSYSCSQPLDIMYDPVSDEPTGWTWIFSDGSISNLENPVQNWVDEDTTQYTLNGAIFDVTYLTVYNSSGCFASSFGVDTIWYPNARFMPDVSSGCVPLEVIFSDSSSSKENIISWHYDFGDGNTLDAVNSDPVSHTYTSPGEYLVSLIIENSAGCIDTSYFVLIEAGDHVALDFQADITEICPGDSVHFTALNIPEEVDAWHYYTDEGRSWHCFQDPNPIIEFSSNAGIYDVTLTAEYNGCYSEFTIEDYITVNGPIAHINYQIECETPFEVQFQNESSGASNVSWDFGDGNFSSANNPTHTYATTGDYLVILTASGNNGCPPSNDTVVINIRNVQAYFEIDDHLCNALPYSLDASGSTDANVQCYKGFTWYFSYEAQRPISTTDTIIEFPFVSNGAQTVSLVIEGVNGCRDTLTRSVFVHNIDAQFVADDYSICIPTEVQFTDQSVSDTTLTAWSWTFGDTQTGNQQNPAHTFTNYGINNFQVILQSQNILGCTDVDTAYISVYSPVSTIVTNPGLATLCVGEPISFFATDFNGGGSSLSWFWDLDNGQSGPGQSFQNVVYTDPGTYTASVIYTEIATGCMDTATRIVQVQDYPVAMFSTNVDNEPILCYPQNVFFSNETQSGFQLSFDWDFGNGQFSTAPNPATTYDKGTYTTTMIVSTPYGCSDTTTQTFVVVGPEGDFSVNTNQICKGDTIIFTLMDTVDVGSFQWDFGDGVIVENISPVSHAYNFYPPSGQTTAKLILSGENEACTYVVEVPINFYNVQADFIRNDGIDTSLCFGIPYPFENTSVGANIFQWDFGDGSTSNQQDPNHIFPEPGNYPVQLIAINATWGCIDTITYIAVVDESLSLQVFGDEICQGDTATVGIQNASTDWVISWTPAGPVLNPDQAITGVVLSMSDTVNVTVTDAAGCQGQAEAGIIIYEPYEGMDWDTIIAEGGTATLPFDYDPAYIYNWAPSGGLSCTNCSNPQVSPLETTIYTLQVTDPIGCTNETFEYTVTVYKEEVDIPNAFSPNGDEINDFFNVIIKGDLPPELARVQRFDIYNRWGEKIYENGDSEQGWDGNNKKGKPQPTEVYVFVVEVLFFSGKVEILKGDVTLIR